MHFIFICMGLGLWVAWRNRQRNTVLPLLHPRILLCAGWGLQALDLLHASLLPFLLGSSGAEQRPQDCDTVDRKAGRSQCEPCMPCSQTPACSLSLTLQAPGAGPSLVGKLSPEGLMRSWILLLWPDAPILVIQLLLWPVTQLGHCLVTLDFCTCAEFQFV